MQSNRRRQVSSAVQALEIRALLSAATLDPVFGSSGLSDSLEDRHGYDVEVQPDGRVVVGAVSEDRVGSVTRFNEDGTRDSTFGVGGIVRLTGDAAMTFVSDLELLPNGQILVAGTRDGVVQYERLNSDGSVDISFNAPVYPSVAIGRWVCFYRDRPGGADIQQPRCRLTSGSAIQVQRRWES